MLFGLGIAKEYLQNRKVQFSESISIQDIIEENQEIGGNLHILIARIIEKAVEAKEGKMTITLSGDDLFSLQSLASITPDRMFSLDGVPDGSIVANIAFSSKEIKCDFVVTSSDEEVFPSMDASFGFKLGSTSWIDMIKYQIYKPKLKKIITKYRVKQVMDNWLPQEDLTGFDQLPSEKQDEIRERIATAYAQAYNTTVEQMEQLDIDVVVNKFKTMLADVLKPTETLNEQFNITLVVVIDNNVLQVTAGYNKVEE